MPTVRPDHPLVFSLVTTEAECERLSDAWLDLYLKSAPRRFCLDPYWCQRIWELQERVPGHRPAVIAGHRDGKLCLIWPLVTYRARLWRVARGLSENLADFDDLLVAEAAEANAWRRQAWAFAIETLKPDMMLFRRVPEGGGLDELVTARMPVSERRSHSLVVDFSDQADWESYTAQISKKLRMSLRRGRRWLERIGEVRFEDVTDEPAAFALIEWVHRQKLERLGSDAHNKREKTEHAAFGEVMPFLVEVAVNAFRGGRLKVLRLAAGEETVAVNLVLVEHRRVVGWLYAFDDTYLQAGPGNMVCMECLAWAYREGFAVVDMMPEPDPYKQRWTDRSYGVRDIRVATTAWGRLLVAWHRSSLRGLGLGLYMRAPRPVQLAIRRLFR